jgi:8-oxo-dGTP diphosphatase
METLTNSSNGNFLAAHGFALQAIAVDIVLFTIQGNDLKVLLVRRPQEPFNGHWALPGTIVQREESIDAAAARALQEKTGIGHLYLEQLYTFGDPTRDPRERVISVTYYAVVHLGHHALKAQDKVEAQWFTTGGLPQLAFDHTRIVTYALSRLRSKINYTTICFQLLPDTFTLSELQNAYEVILDQPLDKRNFRRKMLQLGILKETNELKTNGRQRPARLYTFTEPEVVTLQERGLIIPFQQ